MLQTSVLLWRCSYQPKVKFVQTEVRLFPTERYTCCMPEPESTTAKPRASRSSERFPTTVNVSKILVPIDFTRRSEQTIAYGLQLARFWRAKMFFLHVLPRVEEFAGFPFYREISSRFGSVEQTHSAAREKAWNELAKLKR
jgi:hypothetical protein